MSSEGVQSGTRGVFQEEDEDPLRRRLGSFAVLSIALGAISIFIRWVSPVLPSWYRFFASGPPRL